MTTITSQQIQTSQPSSAVVPGMNERLALGLAKRYVREWFELHMRAFDRAKNRMPCATRKRAAAYRSICEWYSRSVPSSMKIFESPLAANRGKSKDEMFYQISWDCTPGKLFVMVTVMMIPSRNIEHLDYCSPILVTHHAVARVFQRLRTNRGETVIAELNVGALTCIRYIRALTELVGEGDTVLVPTPNGALVIVKDTRTEEGPMLVVRTWLCDSRMQYEAHREAVMQARAVGSIVLRQGGQTLIIDPEWALQSL